MSDTSEWGARPVFVGGAGQDMSKVEAGRLPVPQPADAASALARLLKGADRKLVDAAITAGLPAGGGTSVLVAGLRGGSGVSTVAAQLGVEWLRHRTPVVWLDASSGGTPGLGRRLGHWLLGNPRWTELPDDTDQIRADFTAAISVAHSDRGTQGVLISDAQDRLEAFEVAAVAAAVAACWPLTIIDGGTDPDRVADLVAAVRPTLLITAARLTGTDLRQVADWMASLAAIDRHTSALVAVCEGAGGHSEGRSAMSAISGCCAGRIVVPRLDGLIDPADPISDRRECPAESTLAAAVAVAATGRS